MWTDGRGHSDRVRPPWWPESRVWACLPGLLSQASALRGSESVFRSSQGPPTRVGISPSDGSRQRGCGWWTADLVSLVSLDGWSLPQPRVWAQSPVHPYPPPRCGARTQGKGPAGGRFPLVTASPFPPCQSRRQKRREARCSRRSHLRNRNSDRATCSENGNIWPSFQRFN